MLSQLPQKCYSLQIVGISDPKFIIIFYHGYRFKALFRHVSGIYAYEFLVLPRLYFSRYIFISPIWDENVTQKYTPVWTVKNARKETR